MASFSSQPSRISQNLSGLGCTRLNDDVYELYKPASAPINLEVVFFHGFQAVDCEDAFIRTWMTADGSACWLNTWLAKRFPQARILSVSYDSSTRISASTGRLDMYLIGENLVHSLIELEGVGQNCAVALVGHCVGGLVLKEVCLKVEQFAMRGEGLDLPHRMFLRNMKGTFFYETAHLGSEIAAKVTVHKSGPLLDYFQLLDKKSARINAEFSRLRHQYHWKSFGINAANETRTMQLLPYLDPAIISNLESESTPEYSPVVREASGRYDVDAFATIFGVDHFSICNPKDEHSNSFLLLDYFLGDILREEERCGAELQLQLRLPPKLIRTRELVDRTIELLDLQSPDVIRLSLVGMNGVGKSTLAKQILMTIQHQFDFTCFIELESVPQKPQLRALEELVAQNLYRGSGTKVSLKGGEAWCLLRGRKVLMIVDDVDSEHQLPPILLSNWCGEGSRLITTSCVKGLMPLREHFKEFIVPFLSESESEELFVAHVGDYVLRGIPRELVSEILDECDGLPLMLELVGCYLSKKYEVSVWRGALERLRTSSALHGVGENRVWSKLQMIVDDFNRPERKIFLDLASFDLHSRERKQYALNVLNTSWTTGLGADGVFTDMALGNLMDRCFVRIVPVQAITRIVHVGKHMDAQLFRIHMHSVLRNMGRCLSRPLNAESEVELGRCRRLWRLEDAKSLLNETKGGTSQNKMLEALSVAMDWSETPEPIKWSSISKFEVLRLFRMSNVNMTKGSHEFILPQSLAMLHMVDCRGPHQRRLCPWWQPEWPIREENVECLGRLSVLLLDNCNPIRLPKNFHRLKNLKILMIHDSGTEFMQLPEKLGLLSALEELSLSVPVKKFPDSLLALSSLRSLTISSCLYLTAWPIPTRVNAFCHMMSLTSLVLEDLPALANLPETFGGLKNLKNLWLEGCHSLQSLPEEFGALQELRFFSIRRCKRMKRLCESFDSLRKLDELVLTSLPAFQMLPDKFGHLPSLQTLSIRACGALRELPESFIHFQALIDVRINRCDGLVSLWQNTEHCGNSRHPGGFNSLELPTLQGLPESLAQVRSLQSLEMDPCGKLEDLPGHVTQLPSLKWLYIEGCDNLVELPDLTKLSSLVELSILDCPSIVCKLDSVGDLKSLRSLNIQHCPNFMMLPESSLSVPTALRQLKLERCGNLPESLGLLTSLTDLTLEHCGNLPKSLGLLTSLIALTLKHCGNLPESLGLLTSLTDLKLEHCGNLPESLGVLPSLRELRLERCEKLVTLPEALCQLPSLAHLYIYDCENFVRLPEFIGQVTTLSSLVVWGSAHFVQLPNSVERLKSLIRLDVSRCGVFEYIPASLGKLTQLRYLALPCLRDPQRLLHTLEQVKELRELQVDLSGGVIVEGLPEYLKELKELEELVITNFTNLEGLFECLWQCASLRRLDLKRCHHLKKIPESVSELSQLEHLRLANVKNLRELPMSLGQLRALRKLNIMDCENLKSLPESTGQLESLEELTICECDNFEGLPQSLGQLSNLSTLVIEECRSFRELPKSLGKLRALRKLSIDNCENLKTLPESTEQLQSRTCVIIENCDNFVKIPESVKWGMGPVIDVRNCGRFERSS